jgi:hypothetical protein
LYSCDREAKLDEGKTIVLEVDVDDFQRDQYETDGTDAKTGEKKGGLVHIQGDKSMLEGNALKSKKWPKVKVMNTDNVIINNPIKPVFCRFKK